VLKASTDYWKLIEGLIIIVIVLALPGGVRQLWPMIFGERSNASPARQAAPTIAEGRNG
jgi:branched-chain amino acid transport system permease protein